MKRILLALVLAVAGLGLAAGQSYAQYGCHPHHGGYGYGGGGGYGYGGGYGGGYRGGYPGGYGGYNPYRTYYGGGYARPYGYGGYGGYPRYGNGVGIYFGF